MKSVGVILTARLGSYTTVLAAGFNSPHFWVKTLFQRVETDPLRLLIFLWFND